MCTCAMYHTKDHYFGRNLDLEFSYQESVTITPRNFPITFRKAGSMSNHYALIGMAFVCGGFPLYYDATNEFGLSMAGLNFPGNGFFSSQNQMAGITFRHLNSSLGFLDSVKIWMRRGLFWTKSALSTFLTVRNFRSRRFTG